MPTAFSAFVKSRGERRNITKGQMAMGCAILYPEVAKGGRGNKSEARKVEDTSAFAKRVQQARRVRAFSLDLALAVRDGSKSREGGDGVARGAGVMVARKLSEP